VYVAPCQYEFDEKKLLDGIVRSRGEVRNVLKSGWLPFILKKLKIVDRKLDLFICAWAPIQHETRITTSSFFILARFSDKKYKSFSTL